MQRREKLEEKKAGNIPAIEVRRRRSGIIP